MKTKMILLLLAFALVMSSCGGGNNSSVDDSSYSGELEESFAEVSSEPNVNSEDAAESSEDSDIQTSESSEAGGNDTNASESSDVNDSYAEESSESEASSERVPSPEYVPSGEWVAMPPEYASDAMGIGSVYDEVYGGYYREGLISVSIISEIIEYNTLDAYYKTIVFDFENGLFNVDHEQLPPMVHYIRAFNIKKEELVAINNRYKDLGKEYENEILTDREIDIMFDADDSTIKKELKKDTAFFHNGKLYDIYQIFSDACNNKTKIKELATNPEFLNYLEHMRQYDIGLICDKPEFYDKPIDFIIYQINN